MCYNTVAGEIMLEIINYNEIKKYKKYITTDINNNSFLYFDKDLIHKIVLKKDLDYINILFLLDRMKLEELVELKKIIYDYEHECVVGYSIKNYKEYKSLKKLKNRPFELKKQDSIKLVNMYNNILNNGLSYRDFHLGNVLLNPKTNDIKICDLDSITLFESWEEEKYALQLLLESVIEYLYNIKYVHIKNVVRSNYLYKLIDDYNKELSIECILKIIDLINYDLVKRDKKEIIEQSKQLINMGYSKFY